MLEFGDVLGDPPLGVVVEVMGLDDRLGDSILGAEREAEDEPAFPVDRNISAIASVMSAVSTSVARTSAGRCSPMARSPSSP